MKFIVITKKSFCRFVKGSPRDFSQSLLITIGVNNNNRVNNNR